MSRATSSTARRNVDEADLPPGSRIVSIPIALSCSRTVSLSTPWWGNMPKAELKKELEAYL